MSSWLGIECGNRGLFGLLELPLAHFLGLDLRTRELPRRAWYIFSCLIAIAISCRSGLERIELPAKGPLDWPATS